MKHYTVEEVAKELNVNPRTIQREIKRGKLIAHSVGRKYIIPDEELSKYLKKDAFDLTTKIKKFCLSNKSEMITLLHQLVSMPGESDKPYDQEKFAKFLKKKLDELGIRNVTYGKNDSATIHGTYGYADKGILLDCPLDTTPAGDVKKWTYPPFAGVIKKEKMYGRGTADCKAGIVAMIYAVLALKEFVDESKVRIELVFDGGEQNGEYKGMELTLNRGLDVKAGIIGYGGDTNEIGIGARGYHRYTFEASGKSAHTGARYNNGVNALSKMVKFIYEMEREELPKSSNKFFHFGSKLTFSMINGGRAINIIPDLCESKVDIRVVPEFKKEDIEKLLNNVIKKITNEDAEFSVVYKYSVGREAYIVDESEELIQSLKQAIESSFGNCPEVVAHGPAHIGNLLATQDIPVIVRGPIGGNVHAYDEYVEIDSIPITAEMYAQTIINYFKI